MPARLPMVGICLMGRHFIFQNALTFEEKFSLQRHSANANTPKKYLPMIFGYFLVTMDSL
jgi:hypothetical protein